MLVHVGIVCLAFLACNCKTCKTFPLTIFCGKLGISIDVCLFSTSSLEFSKYGHATPFITSKMSEKVCPSRKVMKNSTLSSFSVNLHVNVLFSISVRHT